LLGRQRKRTRNDLLRNLTRPAFASFGAHECLSILGLIYRRPTIKNLHYLPSQVMTIQQMIQ
jgi:hypothetical protein